MIDCVANFDLMLPVQNEVHTGTIAAGLEGGILVVEGNPAENISDPRNIRPVFCNGKLVDRESLKRQWKQRGEFVSVTRD